jgi:uncharacterized protein DUF6335
MKETEGTKPERLPNYDLNDPDRELLVKENLADAGADHMKQELKEHHQTGPALSGGDLDADWQRAEDNGAEAVGGHVPTPDQSVVDAIGRAMGMELDDDEELLTHEELLARRDRHRWELDRRSADEEI